MEDYKTMYEQALERAKKYHEGHTLDVNPQSAMEYVFPVLRENGSEKIRKEIIQFLQLPHPQFVGKRNQEEWIDWLEKQDMERKQLYVRFGDIPSNEKSKIYRGEEEIGYENGVSVYPAFELNGNIVLGLTLPITMTTLYTQQHLLEYDNRPCYLVSGDYVGKGTDGEPLIRNISIIKRLYNYRIKEFENQGEQKPVISDDGLREGIAHFGITQYQIDNWLKKYVDVEKQGEQKTYTLEQAASIFLDALSNSPYNNKPITDAQVVTKELLKFLTDSYTYNPNAINEQKPSDKVEPKFKVGDWIVRDYDNNRVVNQVITVERIDEGCFGYTLDDKTYFSGSWENSYHLWTIKDAKDGDVLVFDNSFILIFKEIVDLNTPLLKNVRGFSFKSYINLDFLMNVFEQGNFYDDNGNKCYPATKEQYDLLFQKMKEAGYKWDAEKKELKKKVISDREKAHQADAIAEMKNPAWSEEDEIYLQNTLVAVKDKYPNGSKAIVPWLKSLKERVQPQLKQEWNEEDEKLLNSIIEDVMPYGECPDYPTDEERECYYYGNKKVEFLKSLRPQNTTVTDEELAQAKKDAYNDALDKIEYHSGEPTFDDGWSAAIWYLKKKNAQPQNTWKPSDEQMRELGIVATGMGWFNKEVLSGLLEQLKKLREIV